MSSIFYEIKHDHHQLSDLIHQAAFEGGGTPTERRALHKQISTIWACNAVGKQELLYPAIARDAQGPTLLRDALRDHETIHSDIEQLTRAFEDTELWSYVSAGLKSCMAVHVARIEHEIFPIAHHVLDEDEAVDLAKRYNDRREEREAGKREATAGDGDLPFAAPI